MDINKTAKRKKRRLITHALMLYLGVFLLGFITFSFSVSPSHFIRFMSAGFIVCLLAVTCVFVLVVYKMLKEIDEEARHEHRKRQKLAVDDGLYECQSCGNRKVADVDKLCRVCGIVFVGYE